MEPAIRNRAGILCAALVWIAPACAQTRSLPDSRSLAASCAACHGTDGHAVRGAAMPRLAGLRKDYFVQQMRSFRDGSRSATVMQQIARGFDDEQTDALAAYFARE